MWFWSYILPPDEWFTVPYYFNVSWFILHFVICFITDLSTTQPNGPMDNRTSSAGNIGTTQQSGQIDNQFFSAGGM